MKKAIETAVSMAYAYLLGTEWVEFSTLRHGPSTAVDWIGGFIRRCLPDLPGFTGEAYNRFSAKSSDDLDSEANWAVALSRPLAGWRSHLAGKDPNEIFGLSTYNLGEVHDMYPLTAKDARGWIQSHFEITATALQCNWGKSNELYTEWEDHGQFRWGGWFGMDKIVIDFETFLAESSATNRNRVLKYLEASFVDNNDTCYWWSTDAYGWHQVAELDLGQHFNLKCWLYKRLQVNDPLSNRYGEICPFTMALNLMTALKVEPGHQSIQSLAELLLEMQQADGSWRSPAILRIPKPDVVKPTLECRRAAEDKGLLSTATVTQALKRLIDS